MATLTVEIDKERDLPALQALLNKMGLKFQIITDDLEDIQPDEMEGIKAGLADIEAGRIHSNEEVLAHINKKLTLLRKKNG